MDRDYHYMYEYNYPAGSSPDGLISVIMSVYLIILTLVLILALVSYIFHSVGLYTIGKRMGKEYPWLAFIPYARDYFQGELAGPIKLKNKEIKNFADLKDVLLARMELFDSLGCRASDHAFTYVPFNKATDAEVDAIIAKALAGEKVTKDEGEKYRTALMLFLGAEYHKRNWAMEMHMNIKRDNNTRMFEKMGPDTGFDCISDWSTVEGLTNLLDALDYNNNLPKTLIFAGNPADNQVFGTILGCFQGTEAASKIQFGTAWWFNDNKDGMEAQIKALGNLGILGKFVGMLTDSRSFLSYPRHEYFRRILCNIIGQWIEDGEYANDIEFAGKLVADICYNNAAAYFNLDK